MMKSAFRCVQIVLLLFGVFGADEDEVKAVSVMEGDPVTLNTDLTQIKNIYLIEWKFGDPVIAKIDGNDISYPSHTEIFRNRLQLDQTGSLTIKNMKTKHSGLYELQISHSAGNAERKFNVTVYASVSDAGKSEMKSVSLMEGDRVTLQTDVTLSGDELIVWRFGDEGEVIAKADIEDKSSALYYDERFRDRLELEQTGSLIITNTRTTDSGFYAVKISSRTQTVNKRFTVTVSEPGLSPGAKAGIGVGVLLCVAAAAAVAVIYYRRKISELQKQTLKVTVTEGYPVTLKPIKAIKNDDLIQWMFGDKKQQICLAEISGKPRKIVTHGYINVADGIFRGRLKLNETGSLTITDITTAHSGLYTLKMISSRGASQQTFFVTVNETLEEISVEGGGSVTLNPDTLKPDPLNPDTEIQGYDLMLWTFGYQYNLIAQIRGGTGEMYVEGAGEIFRGRLELNKTTGSLTIRNFTTQHIGLYKLLTISSRGILCKKFFVFVQRRHDVIAGDPVYLSTDLTKIERDDVIEWRFGDENCLIAEIKGGTRETYDVPDGRFRDRLELDKGTGELTIKNFTAEHEGDYKLKIRSSERNTNWTCSVAITGAAVTDEARGKSMTKGNNDSSGTRGNESASVEIPLMNK